jgi:AcrR family transcriptional regulator
MTPKKQKIDESSSTRDAILDATEEIMLNEGYAAVSSRRIGIKAGLKSKLLHYYFRSMDDLFIAAFQRLEDRYDQRFARAVASEHPIRELWKMNIDSASTGLIIEFIALATHRQAIRALMARSAKRDRSMHAAALAGIAERRVLRSAGPSPTILALFMASVARTLVTERALGVTDSHAEMLAFVEQYIERMDSHTSRPIAPPVPGARDSSGGTPTKPRKKKAISKRSR